MSRINYIILCVALAACVEHRDGIEGVQSLRVELVAPTDPGTPEDRLPLTARDVTIQISAIGADNMVDPTFTGMVDLRAQFLGTLTPPLGTPPITSVTVTAGMSAPTRTKKPADFTP